MKTWQLKEKKFATKFIIFFYRRFKIIVDFKNIYFLHIVLEASHNICVCEHRIYAIQDNDRVVTRSRNVFELKKKKKVITRYTLNSRAFAITSVTTTISFASLIPRFSCMLSFFSELTLWGLISFLFLFKRLMQILAPAQRGTRD